MADAHYVKVAGQWLPTGGSDEKYVKVAGQWRTVQEQFVKVDGIWRNVDVPQPPTPNPGTYILNPTQLATTSETYGFATFNTAAYRGKILEVRARVSYTSFSSTSFKFSWYGRDSGTYYRQTDVTFPNNTIDHRMDTFNGSVLSQFNSGAAIGFTFTKPAGSPISSWISYVRLNLLVA